MRKLFLIFGIVGFLLSACSNDDYFNENANDVLKNNERISVLNAKDKEKFLVSFAGVLSKATYERKDVREFLKIESLKQFDKNYDVLYYLIKDEVVSGESFRDILISYSSKETIEDIETNVPLLNILIPEIMFFDVKPENLDTEDKEIPVVVSRDSETSLFLNGEKELSLQKGEIPDFHVFVVNENSRVVAPVDIKGSLKSTGVKSIMFKSPNYDGSLKEQEESTTKSALVRRHLVGSKEILAYNHFNKDDGSIYQKAFQRDFIYYGITPENKSGNLNRSVSEYIRFIEVDPRTYFKIADQTGTGSNSDDPDIKDFTASQEKRELSKEELLDRMWTKGSYDFKFEIVTSTKQHPQIVYVPLKPNELWNFNIKHTRRHSTAFRRSKNYYKIDPNKFTSKRVYLDYRQISFGKWNLSEESIYRYVNVMEEDESISKTSTSTYESTRVHTSKFNGEAKLSVGLGDVTASGGASAEVTNSNTIKQSNTVTITRKELSDNLGSIKIFFYDPIIDGRRRRSRRRAYYVHTYNTGYVKFAISVK